jgi:hypothetical protein
MFARDNASEMVNERQRRAKLWDRCERRNCRGKGSCVKVDRKDRISGVFLRVAIPPTLEQVQEKKVPYSRPSGACFGVRWCLRAAPPSEASPAVELGTYVIISTPPPVARAKPNEGKKKSGERSRLEAQYRCLRNLTICSDIYPARSFFGSGCMKAEGAI